jgi:hypothetical protein
VIQEIKPGETIRVLGKYFVCVGVEEGLNVPPRALFVTPEELIEVAEKTRP